MDILGFLLDFLLGAAFWAGVIAAVASVVTLARVFSRRRAGQSAAPLPRTENPSWSLTLLVDVDEEAELLRPSVQLRGSAVLWLTRIRVELVDEHGAVRLSSERPLPSWAIGAQLPLPAFSPPDGAAVEDVLGWRWDVVIEDVQGEKARWREHPAAAGPLSAEAELEMPGVG